MYQPEQQPLPHERKENQQTTSSTIGEKISHLGEKLSGTTLGGTHGLPSKEEATVRCLADFAIYPMGTTASFQRHIDEVEKVLKRCGVDYKVHPQCTTMEGEMGAITYAIKACHEALHAMGCPRIASNVRFDTGAESYRQLPPEHAREE